jgi:glucokinase
MSALALDIGPVNFTAGRVSARSAVVDVRRISTPVHAAWESCRELLLDVARDDEIAAVGIACAGPILDRTGFIASAAVLEWTSGFPLADSVRRLFPAAAVDIATDCHCLGLAERSAADAVNADTILAGAGILARAAERSCAPQRLCTGAVPEIDRVRNRWSPRHSTCRHHRRDDPGRST